MDRFHAITVFREVARQNGFAAAARALNLSTPSVSRLVTELESDVGVRLFNRSTRQVALTEDGEEYLRRSVALLDELDVLDEEMRRRRTEARGHLRISSVVAFGQEAIAPSLPLFMSNYPNVSVELHISNRKVDLVQEHFDLGIRIGSTSGLTDSALKARQIFSQRLYFVATPGYASRYGLPETLDELENHMVVKQVSGSWGRVDRFVRRTRTIDFSLPEKLVVNSPNAARNVVLTGEAIGLLADYLVSDLVASGRLQRVLPELETKQQPVFAVFVHRNFMPAKVRAFIDFLSEHLRKYSGG